MCLATEEFLLPAFFVQYSPTRDGSEIHNYMGINSYNYTQR